MSAGRVLIVGAGPCGLACARELTELGHRDHELLESHSSPGGLASSVVDANGFTWDRGGHVVFSHYGEFDRLLADVMGDDLEHHDRSSYVHVDGAFVPYPFQNNLHHLPDDLAEEALAGLIETHLHRCEPEATVDFETWMHARFGSGICRQFMAPYNEKVWAQPISTMSASWIAERVPVVAWRDALHNLVHRQDDPGWGPNNRFSFPSTGGTGEIYRRAARAVADRTRYDSPVRAVDPDRRSVVTDHGEQTYDQLVWTGALDMLVDLLTTAPDDVRAAARDLVHNSVTIVGLGYAAALTDERSWLYFPDADVPFYRATNFAKYAAANVPGGRTDRYSSWMTEIASSPHRPLDPTDLGERVDAALRSAGLVAPDAEIASVHIDHIERAYPVPTLTRDAALERIQPWLMDRGIYARGRFGAWRYEIGNMDHAVKMGIDVARLLVDGTPEEAFAR
jgi:protoporphyrinogen oxidase